MKKFVFAFLALLILIGVVGCTGNPITTTTTSTTALMTASTDTVIKYAKGFTIENIGDGIKKITDGEKQTLILVPAGKTVPAQYSTDVQIQIPIKSAVILASTFAALMRPLGVMNTVVGSGTNENELYIDELKAQYASGATKYVGGGGMGAPDYEAIAALKPDVVFCSTGYPDAVTFYQKMESLGLHVVVINDFLENDALARLEWMKVIAAFYQKDTVAQDYLNSVENKINDIVAITSKAATKPNVLWGSIFMGTVYASGANSYTAKWIAQAGGSYVFSDLPGSGSPTINIEELYARGKTADIFIYSSTPPYINSIKEIIDGNPVLFDLPVLQYGKVYCMQPWFYQISDKPDEVVADLAYIFHPDLFPGYQLKHFMLLPSN
jgi:iron complex transport system substrate-binding protein